MSINQSAVRCLGILLCEEVSVCTTCVCTHGCVFQVLFACTYTLDYPAAAQQHRGSQFCPHNWTVVIMAAHVRHTTQNFAPLTIVMIESWFASRLRKISEDAETDLQRNCNLSWNNISAVYICRNLHGLSTSWRLFKCPAIMIVLYNDSEDFL
jgi:hypothetical protein